MSDKNTDNVSRRSVLQAVGLSAVGASVVGTATDNVAAADYPYDKIEGDSEATTIRYTKNAVYDNYVKMSMASTLTHLGSPYLDDGTYLHNFGLNTQGAAYHTQDEALRPNIRNHSMRAERLGSNAVLDGRPVDSEYVGAIPAETNDDIQKFFSTAIKSTAGLLSAKIGVVTAGASIIGSMKNIGTEECPESSTCVSYQWDYDFDEKEEVAHQAKFQAITDGSEYGNIEVTAQVNAEVAISFLATIGPDQNGDDEGYNFISPRQPPSKTSSGDGSSAYVSRDALQEYLDSDLSSKSDIPTPDEMSAETAEKYGVRELEEPQPIVVDGERKRVTHVVEDLPVHTFALEPKPAQR